MKWATVDKTHLNTNHIVAFYWYNGKLAITFTNADPKRVIWVDPDRELYLNLCRQQGIRPVED